MKSNKELSSGDGAPSPIKSTANMLPPSAMASPISLASGSLQASVSDARNVANLRQESMANIVSRLAAKEKECEKLQADLNKINERSKEKSEMV